MATFVASRTAVDVLENKWVEYALLGVGGLVIYEFWDVIKVFLNLGGDTAKVVNKLGEKLGEGVQALTPAIDEGTKIAGAVIGDIAGEGTGDLNTGEVAGVGVVEGLLGPFGTVVPFLTNLFGDKPKKAKPYEPWLNPDDPCHPDNVKGYTQLENFNDWRPGNIQEAFLNASKQTGSENIYKLEYAHRWYIQQVKGGIADFTVYSRDPRGAWFTVWYGNLCPFESYGATMYPLGLAYVLMKAGQELDGVTSWDERSRDWIVDTLNAEGFASSYLVDNNADMNIVRKFKINYRDSDGTAVFYKEPVD